MSGRIEWSELFFSWNGRVNRMPFLVAAGILLLLFSLYESVVESNLALHLITGLPVYGLLGFTAVCALAKRLHDRGRSAWWSAPVLISLALVTPWQANLWDFVAAIFLVWATVELALMPGEQGDNRFGPNPQRPAAQPYRA